MDAQSHGQVTPNPALQALIFLEGDWDMALSNGAFLPNPSDTIHGPLSFYWVEHGAFLVMRMGDKPPAAPQALWLVGRDDSSPDYRVLYYDARSVSRVYQMSFADGLWKMWRESPGFSQRFEARLVDGNTIKGAWEKSTDGLRWEHDFDVLFARNTAADGIGVAK